MTTTVHEHPDLGTSQALPRRISVMFANAGMTIGTCTARIPAVQQHLELSDGQLSVALLALAGGGLAGMRSAGRLIDRHGTTRVMTATARTLIPIDRVAEQEPYYSGKRKRHGVNVQDRRRGRASGLGLAVVARLASVWGRPAPVSCGQELLE